MAGKMGWLTKHVRFLVVAEAISGTGIWLTMIAITTELILRGEGGVAASSGIMLAGLLPVMIASPLAGRLADLRDRKWLMVGSEVASALAVAGLVLVSRPAFIYALLAAQSFMGAFYRPARIAAITNLAQGSDRQRVNALLNQVSGLIKAVAPAAGGFLVALAGPRPAMLLNVLSYALAAILLSRLPSLRPQTGPTPVATSTGEAVAPSAPAATQAGPVPSRSVLRTIFQTWNLRALALAMFAAVVFISGIDLLLAVYVKEAFAGSERIYGSIVSALGAGVIVGGLWLMLRKRVANPWQDLSLGLVLLGLLLGGFGAGMWVGPYAWLAVAMIGLSFLGGIGDGLAQVQLETLVQTLSPPDQLGQVAGILTSLGVAARLLTTVAVPLLVPRVMSMATFFALSALTLWLLAGLLISFRRRLITAPDRGTPVAG